jgi:small subunit ribosomal protein S6
MRTYELVLVIRPSLSEADRKKLVDSVKGLLKDTKVAKEEDWGQKPLAYKIKKELAGYYVMMQLESEHGINTDLETKIFNNDDVLRHLLLRTK